MQWHSSRESIALTIVIINHVETLKVRQILRDLLNTHEAQYFNGHEHDFEHIVESGTKVNYVSTGAGMFCCYEARSSQHPPHTPQVAPA
jgi:hypothetical protein